MNLWDRNHSIKNWFLDKFEISNQIVREAAKNKTGNRFWIYQISLKIWGKKVLNALKPLNFDNFSKNVPTILLTIFNLVWNWTTHKGFFSLYVFFGVKKQKNLSDMKKIFQLEFLWRVLAILLREQKEKVRKVKRF